VFGVFANDGDSTISTFHKARTSVIGHWRRVRSEFQLELKRATGELWVSKLGNFESFRRGVDRRATGLKISLVIIWFTNTRVVGTRVSE